MKSLLLTRSDPHTFCPASSGAPSLLATGSLCERIPAFSQRQSPCEAGSERVGRGGEGENGSHRAGEGRWGAWRGGGGAWVGEKGEVRPLPFEQSKQQWKKP